MSPSNNQLPGNLFTTNRAGGVLGKGSLVQFSYLYHKPGHDPTPLVMVTGNYGQYVRGVNLHYLTFPYIVKLLQPNCNNRNFSYYNIKGDAYIVGAFRQYKSLGMSQPKLLDCAFLIKVLQTVRSIDPTKVEQIRRSVREQINRTINPPAQAAAEQPFGT